MKRIGAGLLACTLALGCSSQPKDEGKTSNGTATTAPPKTNQLDLLQAVLLVPWPKDGEGLEAGDWLEITNTSGGKTSRSRIAVVGEAAGLVKVEESNDLWLGYVEGNTVQKADGKIVEAVAARKGEKGQPIKIGPAPAAPQAPSAPANDESVTVPAGTFPASKTVVSGQLSDTTRWVGKEGDVRGIVIKESDDMAGTRELKTIAIEERKVDGKTVKTVHVTYGDGSEAWWARGVRIPFRAGSDLALVKEVRGGTTTEYAWGEDAKPAIDWSK